MNLSDRLALARVETGSTPETTQVPENPTLQDMSLDELDSRLPFKLPDISLEELEEKLGFKLPSLRIDQTEVEALGERLDTTADKEEAKHRGSVFTQFAGAISLRENLSKFNPFARSKNSSPTSKLPRRLAAGIAMSGLAYLGMGIAFEVDAATKPSTNETAVTTTFIEPTSTTTTETAVTSTTPETTTTTLPETPIGKPGDTIAHLNLEDLCGLSVRVVIVSAEEGAAVAEGAGGVSPILDARNPVSEEQKQKDCRRIADYAELKQATDAPDYTKRIDRQIKNHDGTAADFEPVAILIDGTTYYPGEAGKDSVIWGHGSTGSAPFADNGALIPGDTFSVPRMDGRIFEYEVVKIEPIKVRGRYEEARNEIYGYHDNEGSLSLVNCSKPNGAPGGSSAYRNVVRSRLVGEVYPDGM